MSQDTEADKKRLSHLAATKPDLDLLHHFSAIMQPGIGFSVGLLDGTTYHTETTDHIFKDGISIVHDKHRIYFP